MAAFFDEVGHLERIVNIDDFSMTDPKKGDAGRYMKTSLVATSFRFLDESERPKEDKGKSSKRRKRQKANPDEA